METLIFLLSLNRKLAKFKAHQVINEHYPPLMGTFAHSYPILW